MPLEYSEILHRFAYHAPSERAIAQHSKVRGLLTYTADNLNTTIPDCREKDLAVTKLEEAMMWANAAIARHSDGTCECHRRTEATA